MASILKLITNMTLKEKSSGNTYLVILKKGFAGLMAGGFWVSDSGVERFISSNDIELISP